MTGGFRLILLCIHECCLDNWVLRYARKPGSKLKGDFILLVPFYCSVCDDGQPLKTYITCKKLQRRFAYIVKVARTYFPGDVCVYKVVGGPRDKLEIFDDSMDLIRVERCGSIPLWRYEERIEKIEPGGYLRLNYGSGGLEPVPY